MLPTLLLKKLPIQALPNPQPMPWTAINASPQDHMLLILLCDFSDFHDSTVWSLASDCVVKNRMRYRGGQSAGHLPPVSAMHTWINSLMTHSLPTLVRLGE